MNECFDNCDATTNGEQWFYDTHKDNLRVIFDAGSRSDPLFTSFDGEAHYFEPVSGFSCLSPRGLVPLPDLNDHYRCCDIVCVRGTTTFF